MFSISLFTRPLPVTMRPVSIAFVTDETGVERQRRNVTGFVAVTPR